MYILARPKILLLYNVGINMFIFDSDLFQNKDFTIHEVRLALHIAVPLMGTVPEVFKVDGFVNKGFGSQYAFNLT